MAKYFRTKYEWMVIRDKPKNQVNSLLYAFIVELLGQSEYIGAIHINW